MAYLIANDLKRQIQQDNLLSMLNSDNSILDAALNNATVTIKEYISQKYVLDIELADTLAYDITKIYNAGTRIYLDALAYDQTKTYSVNALTLEVGIVYRCSTLISAPEAFNIAHWTALGNQYDMFYVAIPGQVFNLSKYYVVGDQVFWNGKTYTNRIATSGIPHDILLQLNYYNNVPPINVFPDDPKSGLQFWGTGTPITVAAGQLPTGWTAGDNRNGNLVRHAVNIAIWIISFRIAPRNIPEVRDIAYRGKEEDRVTVKDGIIYPDYCSLGWLQSAALGRLSINLPLIQPRKGGRIRFGGRIKNENGY